MKKLALSSSDLQLFFEDRHAALATRLSREALGPFAAVIGAGNPTGVAFALGSALGLYAHLVPEALGGAPCGHPEHPTYVDVRALVLIREALAQVSPLADAIFAVQGLAAYPIVLAGTEAQRRATLPDMIAGRRLGAFALTEPEAGSDVAAIRTTARREGGGWILDGEKVFISNIPLAHHFVVFASTNAPHPAAPPGAAGSTSAPAAASASAPAAASTSAPAAASASAPALASGSAPAPGPTGAPAAGSTNAPRARRNEITAFLVDRNTPGIICEPLPMSVPHPIGRIRFVGCRVPEDALLGEVGGGYRLAMETLDTFRISVGAAANGMAARALREAIAHVTRRRQFGAPLSSQQIVRAYLAEMATDLDAARLLVARAAHKRDAAAAAGAAAGPAAAAARGSTEAAMAKMYATEAAQRIIDRAVQLHGGMGVVEGTAVERLYREIRPLRIYEGTTEIQKLIIARGILERAAAEFADLPAEPDETA